MAAAIVTINVQQQDGGDDAVYHIGSILMDDVPDNIDALINEWWDEWMGEVDAPDSDSEFVDWIIETGKGKVPPFAVVEVTIQQ